LKGFEIDETRLMGFEKYQILGMKLDNSEKIFK
jgi:hypothetical protein